MMTISAFADEIDASLAVQMNVCQANGIKCIDVRGIDGKNVSTFTLDEAAEYNEQMEGSGFTVACIGSPIGKIRMDEDFDEHLDLLRHCCDIAKAFGTSLVRIFSFYPSPGVDIASQRSEVMDRMAGMVEVAQDSDIVLLHENERAIYGAMPDGVKDLFTTIRSEKFKGIFDPANFVQEGVKPYDEGWRAGLDELTEYFHIKDAIRGEDTCVPAGEGQGQFDEIFADLAARNWSGTMTLEPHMAAAGQFAGFTGPDLFAKAVSALRGLCDRHGLTYE